MASNRVLIIGGGIGGLALAQGLAKRGIPYTLFERDVSPSARAQGYRIRIHGSGQEGLRKCLNDELWNLFVRTCAESKPMGSRFNSVDQTPLRSLFVGMKPGQGPPGSRPPMSDGFKSYPADRTLLRSLLLLGQEDNIKFGKAFTHYELSSNGVTAFFDDGSSAEGTFLVGADGITSPVRKQLLPHIRYLDTATRVIYGKTPQTPELSAQFPLDALKGMSVVQDDKSLTLFLEPMHFPSDAQVESNGRLQQPEDYVYWVFGGNAERVGLNDEKFRSLSGEEAKELTLEATKHWDPAFRAMFELQSVAQSAPLRLVSAKPDRPEWSPSARVTLIGDAIHAMMPAGGSGANAALTDAALLAHLISEEGISEKMSQNFTDQMWVYALPFIERSFLGAEKLLGFKGVEGAREVDF
ncbi:cercosporin toxin biosynthesis protein [Tricladium varicosporioides]|nr:cercosporin toxin biosynthesis protein [Hymenoscyphus varicosporioides]